MPPPPNVPNQYLVYTQYSGPDQPQVQQPWLIPPGGGGVYAGAIPQTALKIPYLYSGNGDPSILKVPNDDFVIAATYSGNPTPQNVVVTLQLTGKNAWNTAQASRTTFRRNFLKFIQQIETQFEIASPALLISGATAMITAALTQIMPLPVAETLLFGCGLDSGLGSGTPPSVDLLPGMRLRCEPSLRQYLAPPNQAFSGYMTTGTLDWQIVSSMASGTRVQAFDAFLGAVAAPQITPPPTPPDPLYALLDLQLANTGYRYHRLLYPQNVTSGGAVGSLSSQMNVQLLGANSLADLDTNPPYTRTFFGRSTVVPEICVSLAVGSAPLQPLYVPLGTTVNNLLERFTRWKPLSATDAANIVNFSRLVYSTQQQGSQTAVSFLFAPTTAQITDLRALDLPLWPGDAVRLKFPLL